MEQAPIERVHPRWRCPEDECREVNHPALRRCFRCGVLRPTLEEIAVQAEIDNSQLSSVNRKRRAAEFRRGLRLVVSALLPVAAGAFVVGILIGLLIGWLAS